MTFSFRYRQTLACAVLGASSCLTLWSATSAAHIKVTDPAERSTSPKGKGASCGGDAAGKAKEFPAGSKLTVKWEDTVSHPGWYVISFDPTGDDFDGDGDGKGDYPAQSMGAGMTFKNGTGSLVLADNIDPLPFDDTTRKVGTVHTKEITLPSMPCDKCTLQVMQVMDDKGHAPTTGNPTGHMYFHCVDIKLTGAGAAPSGTAGAPVKPAPSGSAVATLAIPSSSAPAASVAVSAVAPAVSSAPAASVVAPAVTSAAPSGPAPAVSSAVAAVPSSPAAPSPASTPGTGGATAATTTDSADDGGCTVHAPGHTDGSRGLAAAVLALLGAVGFVRRRRA